MFYYLFCFFLGLLLFVQFPAQTVQEMPGATFLGRYELKSKTAAPAGLKLKDYMNGITMAGSLPGEKLLVLSSGYSRKLNPGESAFVPFNGEGFLTYKKVGHEIEYFDRRGELIWKKNFSSYPVSDPSGRLLLLLAGDNNTVFILDENGNQLGEESVSGNFLSDYDFAGRSPRAALVFGDGRLFILDEKGKYALKHQLRENENKRFFAKSVALGAKGELVAAHYLEGERDRIALLRRTAEGKAKELGVVDLPKIYPHILHMAVSEGGLLVTAVDFTAFYSLSGQLVWKKNAGEKIYRPVYADKNFFVYGEGSAYVVLDAKGRRIFGGEASLLSTDLWRIMPGQRASEFIIQTGRELKFIKYQSP